MSTVKNGFGQSDHDGNNPPYLNGENVAMKYAFAISAGASNVCNVQITQQDAKGDTIAAGIPFNLWLSDSVAGLGVTATTASGTVQAKSAAGHDLGILTAKKSLKVQPLATGLYTLEITDSAKTHFYVALQCPYSGQVFVSRQLLTADYG